MGASRVVSAQEYVEPQWKFYFAFEDATGARDTVWQVLDSAATDGLDPRFGEIPVELDPEKFNVWLPGGAEIYFKTYAMPLSYDIYMGIEANNYVLPITLSWDTALFRAPVLL